MTCARERRERIREQERAAVAAHVHDSVLQTLALLQARAGDPAAVRRLARQQERDLRDWLYGLPVRPGDRKRIRRASPAGCAWCRAEVEDDFGVGVEVVTVGDASLDDAARGADDGVTALLGATREAVVNAAKHSGEDSVSVYAEGEPSGVSIWVRDRARASTSTPSPRTGVVCGIRSAIGCSEPVAPRRSVLPGGGTEVELSLPWTAR